MGKLKRTLTLLLTLCLLLSAAPALAGDVCIVKDASAADHITTGCAYLQVQCPLAEEAQVTLSIRDEWGYPVYQRGYGLVSGTFRSGDIHIPLEGDGCDYIVTLTAGDAEYTFTVTREAAMITDTAVYAGGLTLEELTGGSGRKYAVVLDLDALNGETAAAPMLAGGMEIGTVYFTVEDGSLTVQAELWAEGSINKANVYIAADALTARSLGSSRFSGVKTRLGKAVSLANAPYAAVMVQLNVTYDPACVQPFVPTGEDADALDVLRENWQLMQLVTANEAVG